LAQAQKLAQELADGPTFAHGMTKTMLHQEWAMTLDQAIEAEAQAQAICMQTQDFTRAYKAFSARHKNPCSGDCDAEVMRSSNHRPPGAAFF
jgi:enoyl-CoA hydratase/carnithine racemase